MKKVFATGKQTKNIFLICFITCTSLFCQAQPYESIFGEESASWNVFGTDGISNWTDSIHAVKDSVISGTTYKVVRVSTGFYFDNFYFVREDTMNGRLYYRNERMSEEKLFMDLSLNPGDSFFVETPGGSLIPQSWRVDSVFIDNNKKHIELIHIYDQSQYEGKMVFIEGLGPSGGILYPVSRSLLVPELICAWKNGNQTFANSDFENCTHRPYNTTKDLKNRNKNSITLYPNPTRNEIRIAGDESEQFKDYRILSIDGRLVKSGRLNNEKVIQVGELAPGLYVVVLLHDEGSITRKIVIE